MDLLKLAYQYVKLISPDITDRSIIASRVLVPIKSTQITKKKNTRSRPYF